MRISTQQEAITLANQIKENLLITAYDFLPSANTSDTNDCNARDTIFLPLELGLTMLEKHLPQKQIFYWY